MELNPPPPPPPPPLPPPLPLPSASESPKSVCISTQTSLSPIEISSHKCALQWDYLCKNFTHDTDFLVFSLYNHVESILQKGPQCGIVAMAMCGQLLLHKQIDPNDIFTKAKELGFTNYGEMFSVQNMSTLARECLSVHTEIKDNLSDKIEELITHLANGHCVCIPYDTDANHEPAQNRGRRAHWAVILGFCIAISNSDYINVNALDIDIDNPCLIHLKPKHPLPEYFLKSISNTSDVFVYVRQGKSKHLQLCNFQQLCQSNCNLIDIYINSQYVYPTNGIEGLNNQCLFISPLYDS